MSVSSQAPWRVLCFDTLCPILVYMYVALNHAQYFYIGSICGTPTVPSSYCPLSFYRPEACKYYWNSHRRNCQPYFPNGCSTSQFPQSFDGNLHYSYENCMNSCDFRQKREQGKEPSIMVIRVVKFSNGGYKIRKIFA